jgi:hypothetical protein
MINWFKRLYHRIKDYLMLWIIRDMLKDIDPTHVDDMIRKGSPELNEGDIIRLRKMVRGD